MYIDMLAKQALWAVVGVSISAHLYTTLLAHEVFFGFLE